MHNLVVVRIRNWCQLLHVDEPLQLFLQFGYLQQGIMASLELARQQPTCDWGLLLAHPLFPLALVELHEVLPSTLPSLHVLLFPLNSIQHDPFPRLKMKQRQVKFTKVVFPVGYNLTGEKGNCMVRDSPALA